MKQGLRFLKRGLTKGVNLLPLSSKTIGTPRHCQTNAAYIQKYPDVVAYEFSEETSITLPPPHLNRQQFSTLFISHRKTVAQYILQLKNARVWGANGAVITAEDVFLPDVSREFGLKNPCTGHSVFHNVILSRAIRVNGLVAVVTTAGANVYYHWMLDILPRILMLKEAGLFNKISKFILDYEGLPFQKQTLSLLGIDEEKIISCHGNRNFHIEAERLLVPTLPSKINEVNAFECELLKKYFLRLDDNFITAKRVYITRKKTATRTIINEEELINYLKRFDFEVIELEQLSIAQQAQLFNKAKIIAGPHGSAFANVAFCTKGAALLDILPDSNIVTCFYNIAAQMGVNYYGYIDKGVAMNSNYKNDNIQVNMPAFTTYFETSVLP
jgi:capsular polysaccharide biosynthesis protein